MICFVTRETVNIFAFMIGHTGVECPKLKSACEQRYELLQKATAAANKAAAEKLKKDSAAEETPVEMSESSNSHFFSFARRA